MMSAIISTLLILPSEDLIKLLKEHSFTVSTLLPLPSDDGLLTLNLHTSCTLYIYGKAENYKASLAKEVSGFGQVPSALNASLRFPIWKMRSPQTPLCLQVLAEQCGSAGLILCI